MTQARKRQRYLAEIPTLLRDAQPTIFDIEKEPDPKKRKERERARDIATDELILVYREHEKSGKLNELDPSVRWFCESLKQRNSGALPRRKGGRPLDDHRRLMIAVAVAEALLEQTTRRKNVTRAIQHVHDTFIYEGRRFVVPTATIRDIYYDRDPEWRRTLRAELARRAVDRA